MRRPRPVRAALEQRSEDLGDSAERACGEVGRLHRGHAGRGVRERARPAHVVEVVAGARGVPALVAEARDRADDRGVGDDEAQPLEHARPEAVEDDIGLVAQLLGNWRAGGRVPGDDLLAGVDSVVPRRRAVLHRVALGRLDLHDPRSEPHELTACVRAGQLAREVDDELTRERLHPPRTYHYASRVD